MVKGSLRLAVALSFHESHDEVGCCLDEFVRLLLGEPDVVARDLDGGRLRAAHQRGVDQRRTVRRGRVEIAAKRW